MRTLARLVLLLGIARSASALRAPLLRPPKPASGPDAPTGLEAAALRLCAAGWAGVGVACYSGPSSRAIVEDCFGLATVTFEDAIREPAAGLLELVSPLLPLEGVLLLGLASATVSLSARDRSRIGLSLGLTSALTLASGAMAISAGMPLLNTAALSLLLALTATTGCLGARAVSVEAPLALCKEDAKELVSVESTLELFNLNDVSTFYRSSTLLGVLVGAAFAFSPVSPIAVLDDESAVTHFVRQEVGVYIFALLGPVQAALFRAARAGALADDASRALNTATGIATALLVLDGKAQVDSGTALYAALPPDSPIIALVQGGDAARPEANTTAAFSIGLVVALVYLYQAAINRQGGGVAGTK
jgi:hypothetical protein